MRWTVLLAILVLPGCAGRAHLPNDPGGARSDISSLETRQSWLEAHPETDSLVAEAIRRGVFARGMTTQERDVITNDDRRAATGNGYWRAGSVGDEVRYRWYVAGAREPFDDGEGRLVCELVYRDGMLAEVRYCGSGEGEGADPTGSDGV
jgi:hypothetical protein